MKATTLNNNVYHTTQTTVRNNGKKVSIADKLHSYWQENNKTIVCGLMSLNTNADAYAIYKMFH